MTQFVAMTQLQFTQSLCQAKAVLCKRQAETIPAFFGSCSHTLLVIDRRRDVDEMSIAMAEPAAFFLPLDRHASAC